MPLRLWILMLASALLGLGLSVALVGDLNADHQLLMDLRHSATDALRPAVVERQRSK